jgi:segregation and condensation protein B
MEPEEVQPLEEAEEAALIVEPGEGVADVVEPVPGAVEGATEAVGKSADEVSIAEGVTEAVGDATEVDVEPVAESAEERPSAAEGVATEDATESVVEPVADESPGPEGLADVVEDVPEPADDAPAAEDEESGEEAEPVPMVFSDIELKAILQAVIYITDEPLESRQMAQALQQPIERVDAALAVLVEEFSRPESGLQIREIAGGFKMATKPEHHEAVRQFVKNLKPSFKLTPAALETLAVIAYKQPITAPEIMEIRGVQGAGVLKTLVERKLITTAGRKSVIGKPILYKTTKDFLVQFGLKSVNELPTLKEFEELRRLAFSEDEMPEGPASAAEAAEVVPDTAEKA